MKIAYLLVVRVHMKNKISLILVYSLEKAICSIDVSIISKTTYKIFTSSYNVIYEV